MKLLKWKSQLEFYLEKGKIRFSLSVTEDSSRVLYNKILENIKQELRVELENYPSKIEENSWGFFLLKRIYEYRNEKILLVVKDEIRYIYWWNGKCIIIDCIGNGDNYNYDNMLGFLDGFSFSVLTEEYTKTGGILFSIKGQRVFASQKYLIKPKQFLEMFKDN